MNPTIRTLGRLAVAALSLASISYVVHGPAVLTAALLVAGAALAVPRLVELAITTSRAPSRRP
jgi:hypothetical protein